MTGGVITSAGVVLAATFAALGVIPILFLVQLAFIVAFGVLLDTVLVRSLLVPALAYDIGPRIWWPGKLGRPELDAALVMWRLDREPVESARVAGRPPPAVGVRAYACARHQAAVAEAASRRGVGPQAKPGFTGG